jgi:hypothetical protein
MKQTVAQCYSDCVIEGDKGYKMQRQSYIQFRDRYCKDSKADTSKKEGKEADDTRRENEFGYLERKDAESVITTNCGHR